MQKRSYKKLFLLPLLLTAGFAFLGAQVFLSVTYAQKQKIAQKNTANATVGKQLHIQNFMNGPISVQFRYVDLKLSYIKLQNTGTKPVRIRILDDSYILGPNDAIVIDPPKLEYIHYAVEPYLELKTVGDELLQQRFGTLYTYKLPPKTDNEVAK